LQIDFPDAGVSLEAVERLLLVRALEKASGNQSGAARLLGISRDTLRYRMEKFGLGE
jgi:DNA-binding protein Fis